VEVDGVYHQWLPSSGGGGEVGEPWKPARTAVLLGSAEAAVNPRLHQVSPPADPSLRLFIGSQDAAGNVAGMRGAGVCHVLNVAHGIQVPHATGIRYMDAPVRDEPDADLSAILESCLAFIDEGLKRGDGVLVHCNQGVSRSSAVVAAYLMERFALSRDDALTVLRAAKLPLLSLASLTCGVTSGPTCDRTRASCAS